MSQPFRDLPSTFRVSESLIPLPAAARKLPSGNAEPRLTAAPELDHQLQRDLGLARYSSTNDSSIQTQRLTRTRRV